MTRRLGRDAVTWVALGLVVASILIVTTRHAVATKLDHLQQTPGQRMPERHLTSTKPATPDPPATNHAVPPGRSSALTTTTTPPPTPTTASTVATTTSTPVAGTTTTTTTPAQRALSTMVLDATLSYPNDVATTYPLNIGPGPLMVGLIWARGDALSVSLTCGRQAVDRSSAHGKIEVDIARASGTCNLRIARGSLAGSPIAYSLTLRYLGSDPTGTR